MPRPPEPTHSGRSTTRSGPTPSTSASPRWPGRSDPAADLGNLRAPTSFPPPGRCGQASHGASATFGGTLHPRSRSGQPRRRIRPGRLNFHTRGRLMDEGIALLRSPGPTTVPSSDLRIYPQHPPWSRVPLWIGGASPAARRRAAAVGDGWVPLFLTPDDYGPPVDELRQETEAAGRQPGAVETPVVVFARVGPDAGRPPSTRNGSLTSTVSHPGLRASPGGGGARTAPRHWDVLARPGPAISSSWSPPRVRSPFRAFYGPPSWRAPTVPVGSA